MQDLPKVDMTSRQSMEPPLLSLQSATAAPVAPRLCGASFDDPKVWVDTE
jgi:hypothetical protein